MFCFPQTPTSAAFTAQLFDAVHGVALALSDLVNKKVISRTTDVQTVRNSLYQKLKTFDDSSSGFPSATGTNNVMFFDGNQDGPPLFDIVNLVVSVCYVFYLFSIVCVHPQKQTKLQQSSQKSFI